MLLVNTDYIEGKELETLRLVKGSTVFSKNFIRDYFAGLKSIIGGELKGYTEMLNEAREQATKRMEQEARFLNADAIINVRYQTSNVMVQAAEVIVYGTAVKFKK